MILKEPCLPTQGTLLAPASPTPLQANTMRDGPPAHLGPAHLITHWTVSKPVNVVWITELGMGFVSSGWSLPIPCTYPSSVLQYDVVFGTSLDMSL